MFVQTKAKGAVIGGADPAKRVGVAVGFRLNAGSGDPNLPDVKPDLPVEPEPPAAPDVPQTPLDPPVQDPAPGRPAPDPVPDPAPDLPDVGDPLDLPPGPQAKGSLAPIAA